jgi:hypothetical protein
MALREGTLLVSGPDVRKPVRHPLRAAEAAELRPTAIFVNGASAVVLVGFRRIDPAPRPPGRSP